MHEEVWNPGTCFVSYLRPMQLPKTSFPGFEPLIFRQPGCYVLAMKINFNFILLVLATGVTGCCTVDNRDEFEGAKNYWVGRELSNPMFNYLTKQSTARTPKKKGNVEYAYAKDKCKYSLLINEKTQVVKSWAYISEPKYCNESSSCEVR